jgi:hypothetical protein
MCNQGPACPECGKMGGFKITLGSVASGSLISQTNQERTSGAVIYRT